MNISMLTDNEWDNQLTLTPYPSAYCTSNWFNIIKSNIGGNYILVKVEHLLFSCLIACWFDKPWAENGFKIGAIGYGGPFPIRGSPLNQLKILINNLEKFFKLSCTAINHYPSRINLHFDNFSGRHNTASILKLNQDEAEIFEKVFRGSIRTSIRKALKNGITVKYIDNLNLVNAYEVLKQTQLNVNSSYITPFKFFKALTIDHTHFSRGYVAMHNDNILATSVCIFSLFEACHFLHGWDKQRSSLCGNQILIYFMIKEAINNKCNFFNFGESHYSSLIDAKRKWGADDYSVFRGNLNNLATNALNH